MRGDHFLKGGIFFLLKRHTGCKISSAYSSRDIIVCDEEGRKTYPEISLKRKVAKGGYELKFPVKLG